MHKGSILILSLFFLLVSCRNDDQELPTLNVTHPLANSSYAYDDYINIKGTATDESKLKTVKAELFTQTMQSVGLSVEQAATSNSFDFSMGLLLNDRYLSTGQYILKIVATDKAGNEKSTFKNITYTELPYALEGIYVINTSGTTLYQLHKVTGTTTSYLKNFNGSFVGASANLNNRQLILAANGSGKLTSYDPLTDQVAWQVNPLQTLGSYFRGITYSPQNRLTYVVSDDNLVKVYNKAGTAQTFIAQSSTYIPYFMFLQGEYVFLARKQGSSSQFTSFYEASNTQFNSISVTGDVVQVVKKDANELYVFTNSGANSAMQVYTIASGAVWEPIAMPAGTINDAVYSNSNEIFIAHSTGILRYTYANNSLVTWVSGVNASKLYIDDANNRIVAVDGTKIKFYDVMGNAAGIVTHSATITDILLYFNK